MIVKYSMAYLDVIQSKSASNIAAIMAYQTYTKIINCIDYIGLFGYWT